MPSTIAKEPNQGLRRHKMLTAEIRKAFAKTGSQKGKGEEATVIVKFFGGGSGVWLFTEFDGDDRLYGYGSPFGLDHAEWGYSSFREMASITIFGGVPAIERDCYIDTMTVAEYKAGKR